MEEFGRFRARVLLRKFPGSLAMALAPHIISIYQEGLADLVRFTTREETSFLPTTHLLTIADVAARRRIPLHLATRSVRAEQEHCTRALFRYIEQDRTADHSSTLPSLAQRVSLFFDLNIEDFARRYLEEQQKTHAQRQEGKSALVEVILRGGHVTGETAWSTLGIDLSHHHLPFVLWLDGTSSLINHAAVEKNAARQVEDALGCSAPLMLTDPTALCICVSRHRPFALRDLGVFDRITRRTPGLRVAVGLAGPGLEGFRRGVVTARDAQQVALLGTSSEPVTTYRSVGLLSLLARDTERARWFAAEQLGPLWSAKPGAAELRRTLLTYLENGASPGRTAAELHIHRNTVAYRLSRIRELLGRDTVLRSPGVHAALLIATRLTP
jgi:sugar diacid utilization regulator